MTEIKLSTEDHDIADLLRYLDGDHHMSVYDRQRVANTIRAQLPKPAIEEPREFGSIVKARDTREGQRESSGLFWVRQASGWFDDVLGRRCPWEYLTDVEVLRIGVGEAAVYPYPEGDVIVLGPETFKAPDDSVISHKGENYWPTSVVITSSETRGDVAPEETDDYKLGASDTTFNILTKLRVLRSEAITSERKNAYDVAIKTVEAMQP